MARKLPVAFVGLEAWELAIVEREANRWSSRNVVATMALRHWIAAGCPTAGPAQRETSKELPIVGPLASAAAATTSATAQPRPKEVLIDPQSATDRIAISSYHAAAPDPGGGVTPPPTPYRDFGVYSGIKSQISSASTEVVTRGEAVPAAVHPDEIGATPKEEPRAETPWPSVPGFSMPFEAPPPPPAARRRDELPAEPPTPERVKRKQNGYPDPLRIRTTDPENGKVPPPTAMRLADVLDALRAANLGVDVEPVVLRAFTAYPRKNVEEAITRAVRASGKGPAYALGILRKSLCREKGFEFELIDEALAARIVSDNAAYGYSYSHEKLEVTDAAS